ncbi:MAG: radical SAM protein, partial [Sphingopyxis sp.]
MTQPPTPAQPGAQVISFGCRLNIAESEAIRAITSSPVPVDGGAGGTDAALAHNMVIINGCGVTDEAMKSAAAAARRARRENPDARIIVTGCAAQIDPARFAAMPQVDRVLGNAEKFQPDAYSFAPQLANDAPAQSGGGAATAPVDARRIIVGDAMALTRTAPQFIPAFAEHARAFVEVQNGCDHRCTFCIIPYGRGPSRSVPMDQVVRAAQRLVDGGHG